MVSTEAELGRRSAEIAERITGELRSADSQLRAIGLGMLPDHAINGGVAVSAVPAALMSTTEIRVNTTLGAMWRLWAKGKNVYAVHPDMASELWSYNLGTLPGALFRKLEHPNPVAVFAEPETIGLPHGGRGRLLAIVFCGRHSEPSMRLRPTDDEQIDQLAAVAIAEPLNDDGSPVVEAGMSKPLLDFTHMSIPLAAEARFTAFDLAKRISDKAKQSSPSDQLVDLAQRVLKIAVYLCSTEAEIVAPSPRGEGKSAKRGKQKKQAKEQKQGPGSLLRVGWRLGPALKAARQRAEGVRRTLAGAGEGTGKRQYPHRRGGHQKTVWTGPGRAVPDSRLVAPYWVSLDLLDADGAAPEGIIRPVR
ncbi:hypothetical protein ACIRBX_25025 [Kitasatospora sp. NPDC096147]|uniref:hypothetical protein n=1 Tax=Kitasatospora sp. NPDC096147 TaxID=3364093 RepID=UPI0037F23E8B